MKLVITSCLLSPALSLRKGGGQEIWTELSGAIIPFQGPELVESTQKYSEINDVKATSIMTFILPSVLLPPFAISPNLS